MHKLSLAYGGVRCFVPCTTPDASIDPQRPLSGSRHSAGPSFLPFRRVPASRFFLPIHQQSTGKWKPISTSSSKTEEIRRSTAPCALETVSWPHCDKLVQAHPTQRMTDQPPAQAAPAADSEESKSARVTLADICAQGAAHFAHKKYDDAAECYARAAEMQAELNGEMDPSNAEVLFLYGRSLFKVGQGKSDVLGGKAGAAERERGVEKGVARRVVSEKGQDIEKKAGEEVKKDEVEKKEEGKKEGEVSEEKKPLFQFTGDENWDDSDEDEEVRFPSHRQSRNSR